MKTYQNAYIVQSKSKQPCARNWRNVGREYYISPADAMLEARRKEIENKHCLFRVSKFVFVNEVNAAGESKSGGG